MSPARVFRSFIFLLNALLILTLASCNLPLNNLLGVASPTPLPSPTQIVLPPISTGSITGQIWHDLCAVPGEGQPLPAQPPQGCVLDEAGGYRADGTHQADEPGIEGIEISLGVGACPSMGLASTTTEATGEFTFSELSAGTFCLIVDLANPRNTQILIPGEWTAGPADASGLISMTIELTEGQALVVEGLGWDYQFLPAYIPPATTTPSPTETGMPTPTPTPTGSDQTPTFTPEGTSTAQDPNIPTGNPIWRDPFDSGGNWPLYEDEHVSFEVDQGKVELTAFNPDFYEGWMLSWPDLSNFYLEGTFDSGNCSGRDRYGMVVRSGLSGEQYVGYLFGLTCDGRYSLRIWDGDEFEDVISWTSSTLIQAGSGKTHRLGIRAKGNTFMLFVDGKKLAEVQDSTYTTGKFGLFVGSVETEDFQVKVDEIAYWNVQ